MKLFRKRPQPKDEFNEYAWKEPERSSISETVLRLCERAVETAIELGKEPVLLVSQEVWHDIVGDDELRGHLRFEYPPEKGIWVRLYGCLLHVDEDRLQRRHYHEVRRLLPISEFTGQPYDPEWGVRFGGPR